MSQLRNPRQKWRKNTIVRGEIKSMSLLEEEKDGSGGFPRKRLFRLGIKSSCRLLADDDVDGEDEDVDWAEEETDETDGVA